MGSLLHFADPRHHDILKGQAGQEQGRQLPLRQQLLLSTSQQNAGGVPPAIRHRVELSAAVQKPGTDIH